MRARLSTSASGRQRTKPGRRLARAVGGGALEMARKLAPVRWSARAIAGAAMASWPIVAGEAGRAHDHWARATPVSRRLGGEPRRVHGGGNHDRLLRRAGGLGEVGIAGHHAIGEGDQPRNFAASRAPRRWRRRSRTPSAGCARRAVRARLSGAGPWGAGSTPGRRRADRAAGLGGSPLRRADTAASAGPSASGPGRSGVAVDARARGAHAAGDAAAFERAAILEAARAGGGHALTLQEEDDPHGARRRQETRKRGASPSAMSISTLRISARRRAVPPE